MKPLTHFIKHNKPLIFSLSSLMILWLLFIFFNKDLSFNDESISYPVIAIIYNVAVFIYMILDNNLEYEKEVHIFGFVKEKILNLKFIFINILAFLFIVNYATVGFNLFLAFILFLFNNSVTFLVFNLLKNYSTSKYKNDTIMLFSFGHFVFLHLIIIFDSSSIFGNIMCYIPMISIYFSPVESYKILLMSSTYFGYLFVVALGYRKLLERHKTVFF